MKMIAWWKFSSFTIVRIFISKTQFTKDLWFILKFILTLGPKKAPQAERCSCEMLLSPYLCSKLECQNSLGIFSQAANHVILCPFSGSNVSRGFKGFNFSNF